MDSTMHTGNVHITLNFASLFVPSSSVVSWTVLFTKVMSVAVKSNANLNQCCSHVVISLDVPLVLAQNLPSIVYSRIVVESKQSFTAITSTECLVEFWDANFTPVVSFWKLYCTHPLS